MLFGLFLPSHLKVSTPPVRGCGVVFSIDLFCVFVCLCDSETGCQECNGCPSGSFSSGNPLECQLCPTGKRTDNFSFILLFLFCVFFFLILSTSIFVTIYELNMSTNTESVFQSHKEHICMEAF